MRKICYIFAAGELYEGPKEKIPDGALVIAADGGLYHTKKLGIEPDIFLGDFDSANRNDAGSNCVVYPSEKDYTDTFLAVEYGAKAGYTEFEIYGALGGKRLEHTIANLQMLEYFSKRGLTVRLYGEHEVITAVSNFPEKSGLSCKVIRFDDTHSGYLSLFAVGGEVCGVYLQGLKYPLADKTLTTDFPLGVSNEFCGVPSEVRFRSGTLLLVWQK